MPLKLKYGGYGRRTDVYALGVTFYYALNPMSVTSGEEAWRPPSDLPAACHAPLRDLMERMTSAHRRDRPGLGEVMTTLDDVRRMALRDSRA